MQQDFMEKILSIQNKYTFMVAGQPRKGKSTALNNLLGLKLAARCGAQSVTQVVVESTTSPNGVQVCAIDTPGLRAVDDVDSKKVLQDMSKVIGQRTDSFILLYCMSVRSGDSMDDHEIMKCLNKNFGENIWKRCILVLTFCDSERNENYKTEDQDEAYKTHLRDCVDVFKDALGKSTSAAISVKLILDCQGAKEPNKMTEIEAAPDTIVAVPVAKTREDGRKPNILPGFNIGDKIDWIEYAFFEIVKKSGRYSKTEITALKSKYGLLGAVVVGGGAAIGAGVGAVIGGPLGAVIGSGIGGFVGYLATKLF